MDFSITNVSFTFGFILFILSFLFNGYGFFINDFKLVQLRLSNSTFSNEIDSIDYFEFIKTELPISKGFDSTNWTAGGSLDEWFNRLNKDHWSYFFKNCNGPYLESSYAPFLDSEYLLTVISIIKEDTMLQLLKFDTWMSVIGSFHSRFDVQYMSSFYVASENVFLFEKFLREWLEILGEVGALKKDFFFEKYGKVLYSLLLNGCRKYELIGLYTLRFYGAYGGLLFNFNLLNILSSMFFSGNRKGVRIERFSSARSYFRICIRKYSVLGIVRLFSIQENFSKFLVPNFNLYIFENIYKFVLALVKENIGGNRKRVLRFFPFMLSLFLFILISNIIGLVPYGVTVTGLLVVTSAISLMVVVGVNILAGRLHGFFFISKFLPRGCPFTLNFFIIPIEYFSFAFRPVSLSVRLFANIMAGHTLLGVLSGFIWSLMIMNGLNGYWWVPFPVFGVFLLVFLEIMISFVQAYVFTILTAVYLDESINLH